MTSLEDVLNSWKLAKQIKIKSLMLTQPQQARTAEPEHGTAQPQLLFPLGKTHLGYYSGNIFDPPALG